MASRDPDLCTLPVGPAFLEGQHGTDHPTLVGAVLLPALPVLALLVVAPRWSVAGPERAAVPRRRRSAHACA